ncbi:Transcription_factor IIIB 70 kDa subunit BRF [Hexamita inflata]|uniref:Transcription factor IIIB 70 kDa subunit BRF n=1 Tax=Hexamita inflata TaxID=28002 RepID=A0AA86QEA1_9EUKA|nr:Transcription factor IIIB 70 kDa subunit BRF [Hexamita inflata]
MTCLHLNINYDRYKNVCADCGQIIAENDIINELNFGETGGGAFVHGAFVDIDQDNATAKQSSRNATIFKFQNNLIRIAENMQLSDSVVDKAKKYYATALNLRLTQSRRNTLVAATLLAIAARELNLPYLLIDFADSLKINPADLSTSYIKFTEELKIELPIQQPSAFVPRFVNQLVELMQQGEYDIDTEQFKQNLKDTNDMQKAELLTRTKKLVSIMMSLNVHQARKPQLVVGIALYLACLSMNFIIGIEQISEIIFMSPITLQNRLKFILQHDYFKNYSIQQIFDATDIESTYEDVSSKIVQKREERYTALEQNDKSFTRFENQQIYQLEISEDSQQLDDYLCIKTLVEQRQTLYDQLYKDNIDYYIEKRKIQKGTKQRRVYNTAQEGIQNIAEIPKDSRDMLLELLADDNHQQNKERDQVIHESENEESVRDIMLL